MNVHSNWRRVSAPIPATFVFLSIGLLGRAQDLTDGKGAIDRLKQLPGSVQKVREVVQAANFGPFEISGYCEYNWQWYCMFSNCNTWNWSWKFPNYTWLRSSLDQRYQSIQSVSAQFDARFLPVKSWLLNTLPAFSRQVDNISARIQAGDATIRKPGTPPAEVERARQDIIQAIDQLTGSLRQGSEQLSTGVSGLSAFNQQLNGSLQTLESARAGMEQMLSADQNNINRQMGSWPCGKDDALNGYNGIKTTVRTQFQNVIAAGRSFGLDSSQTDQSVSLILGRVLNLLNSYRNVLDSLRAAQITPAGAVQQLRLNVAAAAWRDLSTYARQQLH
jgi:uncharacterized phage infection (PIP) family protein YhgE